MNRVSWTVWGILLTSGASLSAEDAQRAATSESGQIDPQPQVTTWADPRPLMPADWQAPQGGTRGALSAFVSTNDDPEGDMPRELTFLPDGSALVVVNRDTDNVVFFDVATRTITHTVGVGNFPVHVAASPDGRYVVVPNVLSHSVSILDVATHSLAAEVPITGTQPYRVAITTDSALAVVGVINDAVSSSFSVIDLNTLSEIRSFGSSPQGVFGAFFTPESGIFGNIFTQFAVASDNTTVVLPDRGGGRVSLYDLNSGTPLASLPTAGLPTAVDVSADGTTAVVSHEGPNRRITEIDLPSRMITGEFGTAADLFNQVIRITPDRSHAMAAILNNVIFVNLTSGATTATLSTGTVGDIEISFDGQYAFISNFNARVINIATQTIVNTITFAAGAESAASPTALRAVALNNRFAEDVQVYNINGAAGFFEGFNLSGQPPEGDATRSLSISPDGKTVVAGNNTSRNVSIIDLPSRSVRSYVDTGTRVLGVAITPDGTHALAANAGSNTLTVIDLSTDTAVANVPVPATPTEVRVSPDSQTAYVSSVAGTDLIYFIHLDGANSSVIGTLPPGQMGSITYTYGVFSGIELSPDGSILAACISFEDQLLLIDTATRTELVRLPVGDFPVRVAFSPDGTKAYVVHSFSDDVYKINIAGAGSSVETVIPGIDFPLTVNVDATNSFVYVGSFNSQTPAMYVINTASNSIVRTVPLTSARGPARAAHLDDGDGVLYLATTQGQLVRMSAAGAASAIIDSTPLSNGPSDMVFSNSRKTLVVAQPIPDGVDLVTFECPGDVDGDGDVDLADLGIVLSNFGCTGGSCPGDADGDGDTDLGDLGIVLSNYGQTCP